ncbi:MAG TPA: DUF2303 family protein [Rhodanobacteraceae bacterium]|nr:DUF2303 family protein [Rhodanobacteraceae bacterium]
MDSSAIQLIQDTAIEAAKANRLDTDTPAFITPDGRVVPLEFLQGGRSRFRGRFQTSAIEDFVAYVRANQPDSLATLPAFVDIDAMAALAYFNLGSAASPGHADWTAQLTLKASAPFAALKAVDGKQLSQKQLGEFLEDWAEHIQPHDADGEYITVKDAVQRVRKVKVKATAEATHAVGNYANSRSAMEDVEASSSAGQALPESFDFSCVPYQGLTTHLATLRPSLLTSGEGDNAKPVFVLRWAQREAVIEAIAENFKAVLASRLEGGATLTLGTFTP